ncbi:hypothetical protein CBF18_20120 [Mastigocladus laminosus WC112]|nr:hypothetical protein CBF18_20120 [Mastigocladus laminosus WC112]
MSSWETTNPVPSPCKGEGQGLTGVGFLHLGGVKTVEIINRSRSKRTPATPLNLSTRQGLR